MHQKNYRSNECIRREDTVGAYPNRHQMIRRENTNDLYDVQTP